MVLAPNWKIVDNSDSGTADKFGGNDVDKISMLLNGETDVDDVVLDSNFRSKKTDGIQFVKNELTSASSINLDFAEQEEMVLGISNDITFTTSNLDKGRWKRITIVHQGSSYNLHFPQTWKWIGEVPPAITGYQYSRLELLSEGYTDVDVVAKWSAPNAEYDLRSGIFRNSFELTAETSTAYDFCISNNDDFIYVADYDNGKILQYMFGIRGQVDTLVHIDLDLDTTVNSISTPLAIELSPDGTKAFILGEGNLIHSYDLSVPYMIYSASHVDSFDLSTDNDVVKGISISQDGTNLYIGARLPVSNHCRIKQYSMDAWDVTSLVFVYSYTPTTSYSNPNSVTGVWLKPDGNKIYWTNSILDGIFEGEMTTPYDLSTNTELTLYRNISSEETTPQSIKFNSDGSRFYLLGFTGNDINEYRNSIEIKSGFSGITPYVTYETTSATEVMTGLNSPFKVAKTTVVIITFTGYITNDTDGETTTIEMRYGSGGAPPTSGDSTLGLAIFHPYILSRTFTASATQKREPVTLQAVLKGLVIDETYWVDINQKTTSGSTGGIVDGSISVVEI